MIIRPATAADATAIVEFWNPQIRDTAITFTTTEKTPQMLSRDIVTRPAEGKAFLVAEEAGAVLGFATYYPFRNGPGYAHTMEHSVILAPSAWGRGIGRALMAALENHARAAGVHSLIAAVSPENPGGLAFHEKIGFRRVAEIPEAGRKFDRWINLIILQKLL